MRALINKLSTAVIQQRCCRRKSEWWFDSVWVNCHQRILAPCCRSMDRLRLLLFLENIEPLLVFKGRLAYYFFEELLWILLDVIPLWLHGSNVSLLQQMGIIEMNSPLSGRWLGEGVSQVRSRSGRSLRLFLFFLRLSHALWIKDMRRDDLSVVRLIQ